MPRRQPRRALDDVGDAGRLGDIGQPDDQRALLLRRQHRRRGGGMVGLGALGRHGRERIDDRPQMLAAAAGRQTRDGCGGRR